ncbi:MAG: cytochrome c oxidase subunit II [Chloroflexi bacterium]|nr:cytochrome c oxidase subunit II [Chloroflexota bacterium]
MKHALFGLPPRPRRVRARRHRAAAALGGIAMSALLALLLAGTTMAVEPSASAGEPSPSAAEPSPSAGEQSASPSTRGSPASSPVTSPSVSPDESGDLPGQVLSPGEAAPPGFFPPAPVTEQGRDINNLYSIVFWIAAAIFIFVEALILWAVLRYRRLDDTLPAQTHGNRIAEFIWTLIPAVIVVFLFVASTTVIYRVEAKSENPDLTVDVYGFQWQWSFGYDCPQEFGSAGGFTRVEDCGLSFTGQGAQGPEMVLPVGQLVQIRLHGSDVNHAFYVPQFLYKKDVIPGQVNRFEVRVEQPGTYTGQCAEFCGLAHASMNFTVRAVPPSEYDAWKTQAEQEAEERENATPPPSPSGDGGDGETGATVEIAAENASAFTADQAEAPADQPFSIAFDNRDPSAPHNVSIRGATPEGDFVPPIADPGQQASYEVPPLAAGEYEFYCVVHPNMQGTLTVR